MKLIIEVFVKNFLFLVSNSIIEPRELLPLFLFESYHAFDCNTKIFSGVSHGCSYNFS